MKTFSDRFRRWYEHERDSYAKAFAMLASVPEPRRSEADYEHVVDCFAHIDAARQRWLHRLGHWPASPAIRPHGTALAALTDQLAKTEQAWIEYLSKLGDADLSRTVEWTVDDGKCYRWDVEGILTQMNGHGWYHFGQIAQLVDRLGGQSIQTDYIFWCKLPPIEIAPS